ncbi:MAG: tetratricopeptide repeat protein, partial [Anaerolineales bacterium]
MMTALRINLLGPPQIFRDEEFITHSLSQKSLGLLAYLVMCPSRGYTREKLTGMFWGETDEEHAKFNLRRALWSLRKVINPPGAPSNLFIRYRQGSYSFNPSSDYWVDVNAFEMAANGSTMPDLSPATEYSSSSKAFDASDTKNLHRAIQLYRGKLLEGYGPRGCPEFMDWLSLERNRLEQQFVRCLRKQAVERAIQNEYQQAIAYYEQILSVDPLHEATQCDLMVAYFLLGKRDKAVEQFLEFSKVLHQQLELEPLPETTTLFQDIRNGTLTVEGSSYRLTSAKVTTRLSAPPGPFVGRKPEQIKLNQILESTMQGVGHLAVVSGEAGVGKTRLIEEFLYRKSETCPIILRARCYAQEQGLLYQPIIDALRTYLSTADFAYIKRLSHLWLGEVAKLIPELHGYLPHLPVSLALVPDQDRNRLFEGLAQFITHLSKRDVLILFLDDIHAADLPTFELIHYLARRLSSTRVLLLCTLRQEALVDRPSLSVLLRELTRNKQLDMIPLARFSEREVLELLDRTVGTSARLPELGHRLYLETGGNPFFLVEMLRAREEGQDGMTDNLTVPSNVRDVIRHRLNRLDEKSRYIVTMASIIGRQFSSTTLQQVYDGDKESLLGELDQLLLRGWIVEPPGVNPGTYDFSHGLVRDAVYQMLSTARRVDLHHQLGVALEKTVGAKDEFAGVLAHHFWKANDTSKGIQYALQAASHARRLYANGEAIAHYQRVLDFAIEEKAIFSAAELIDIQCRLGQCYEFLGKYDEAITVYKAALPEIRLSDTSHRRIYFQLASAHDRKGEYDQALELFNELGTHLSEPKDPASRLEAAMISRGMARVNLHRERSHQAMTFCREALALIRDDDSNEKQSPLANRMATERVAVYEIMANSYFHLGNYEAAVSHFMLALKI